MAASGRYTSPMKLTAPILSAVMAWTATAACAQWQWIDKDGRKVFSDRAPPAEIQDKDILKRPVVRAVTSVPAADTPETGAATPGAAASAPKGSDVDKELEAKKKQAVEQEMAKRRADEERMAKARIEACARAKQTKATLDSGQRISQFNKAGEPEIMNEATRAAEVKRVQGIIESTCR